MTDERLGLRIARALRLRSAARAAGLTPRQAKRLERLSQDLADERSLTLDEARDRLAGNGER